MAQTANINNYLILSEISVYSVIYLQYETCLACKILVLY